MAIFRPASGKSSRAPPISPALARDEQQKRHGDPRSEPRCICTALAGVGAKGPWLGRRRASQRKAAPARGLRRCPYRRSDASRGCVASSVSLRSFPWVVHRRRRGSRDDWCCRVDSAAACTSAPACDGEPDHGEHDDSDGKPERAGSGDQSAAERRAGQRQQRTTRGGFRGRRVQPGVPSERSVSRFSRPATPGCRSGSLLTARGASGSGR